jgi:hypothetical protein
MTIAKISFYRWAAALAVAGSILLIYFLKFDWRRRLANCPRSQQYSTLAKYSEEVDEILRGGISKSEFAESVARPQNDPLEDVFVWVQSPSINNTTGNHNVSGLIKNNSEFLYIDWADPVRKRRLKSRAAEEYFPGEGVTAP